MKTALITGVCLLIAACGSPPPPDREQKFDPQLESLSAHPPEPPPDLAAEREAARQAALLERWVRCVWDATGGDWEKESVAKYNCRSDRPDVDVLIDYSKTLRGDSARILLEVYGETERPTPRESP